MEKPTFPELTLITGPEVKEIRKFYRLTPGEFGRYFPVMADTIKSWESGRRSPYGPCTVRLQQLKAYADHVKEGKRKALKSILTKEKRS